MIDCEIVQDNLSAYIDDELPADEGRKIYHHLQTCQACNKEYMELKITAAIMRSLNDIDPPPEMKERVIERLRDDTVHSPVSKIKKIKWYSFGAVAAGLLLLVGSWSLLFDGGLAKFPADSAGTQQIAFEAAEAPETDAVQDDLSVQPFSLAMPEGDAAPPEAFSAVPEEPLPMDMGEPSGETGVGAQEFRDDLAVESKEAEDEGLIGFRRFAPEQLPPEAREKSANTEEISIAAIEPEQESTAGRGDSIDASMHRAAMMSTVPVGEGLQMELRIKTQDLSQTHKAIERIAQVYELKVLTEETAEMISIEVFVPISQQGTVKEELEGLGLVTSEAVSNPDLYRQISALIDDSRELEQQQIELRALINNGGSPENVKVWHSELTKVIEEVKEITAQLQQLEAEYGLTCIKLILEK
jgi:hypothetical protein